MLRFIHSGFGRFLAELTTGLFTRPSERSFFVLALGWALSSAQHTVSGYLWLSAGVLVKHFSRFYVFLGAPFRRQLEPLWQRVLARALVYVPPGEPVVAVFDETVSKKSGRRIEGLGRYRNGAGSARQEYRTLLGVQFVIGILLIRLPQWPEQFLALPFGIDVCLQEKEARRLGRAHRSRSVLARGMLERLCRVTDRPVLSLQDGGYATKEWRCMLRMHRTTPAGSAVSGEGGRAHGEEQRAVCAPRTAEAGAARSDAEEGQADRQCAGGGL